MRDLMAWFILIAAGTLTVSADARDIAKEGVKGEVGKASIFRRLVPAASLEESSAQQFLQLQQQAAAKGQLLPQNHPTTLRLRAIAAKLVPYAIQWNEERAPKWKWEVIAINSPTINAFCMPGGKIVFFTGIIDKLKLTDDEIAIVLGHEMAHALREHARARVAKSNLTNIGSQIIGRLLIGGDMGAMIGAQGGNLLTLRFSRKDESEADLVGLELAARAGHDPRTAVRLWEKMAAANKGAPPQWLSTHPANSTRIAAIKAHLPNVMPIYERTQAGHAEPLHPNAPKLTSPIPN